MLDVLLWTLAWFMRVTGYCRHAQKVSVDVISRPSEKEDLLLLTAQAQLLQVAPGLFPEIGLWMVSLATLS
jgi:uncharacterized protein with PIN domain